MLLLSSDMGHNEDLPADGWVACGFPRSAGFEDPGYSFTESTT